MIENLESDSITPLKNESDELDIPVRTKRQYNKRSKFVEPSENYLINILKIYIDFTKYFN